MKKILRILLEKFGIYIILKKKVYHYSFVQKYKELNVDELEIKYLESFSNGGLKEKLLAEGKNRWLDIGGGLEEEKFFTLNLYPENIVKNKDKYYRLDIINATDHELEKLGKFDLIRMQHVFEHFTPEDGFRVLNNCSKILNEDSYLLISTPDLKTYVGLYLNGKIKNDFEWAYKRISSDSPNSFYFSIFSHSMPYEKHEWCYDADGLKYIIDKTGKFKDVTELKIGDELANIPFTHKRPHEDVCIIAKLK